MKNFLAIIGGFVLFLAIAGSFGIGHFTLLYGPDKTTCTKESK